MARLIIRNLDNEIIQRLKQRARQQGLSLEELVRRILANAAKPTEQEIVDEMHRIRAMSPPITEPPFGWQLIREDRDRR